MRALSIRQPYAELILRGIKPIEFRSRPTKIIGERFYIYVSNLWTAAKLSDAPFPFRASNSYRRVGIYPAVCWRLNLSALRIPPSRCALRPIALVAKH